MEGGEAILGNEKLLSSSCVDQLDEITDTLKLAGFSLSFSGSFFGCWEFAFVDFWFERFSGKPLERKYTDDEFNTIRGSVHVFKIMFTEIENWLDEKAKEYRKEEQQCQNQRRQRLTT